MTAARRLLWVAWGLSFALALVCAGVFIHGVVRDARPFDASIRLDLDSPSKWISAPFRVWGEETYSLLLRSVNHDPALVGRPLMAGLELRVVNPKGQVVLQRSYEPGETGHVIPDNYGDARLATLHLSGWPFRSWDLQVRVTDPDPEFATVYTDVEMYEQRPVIGMGGLITYAMIVPSAVLMLLALVLAILIARHGPRLPLIATVGSALLVLLVLG